MNALAERLRWRIARLLDRLLPGQCWAELACWALGRSERRLPWYSQKQCRADLARCGTCYCGKLRTPGVGTDGPA